MASEHVLEWQPIAPAMRAKIRAEFPDLAWTLVRDPHRAHDALGDVTIIYGLPAVDWLEGADRLAWIHVPFAGIPADLCRFAHERSVLLTNSAGIYNQTIAEHVLMFMLALARRLDAYRFQQGAGRYATAIGPPMRTLSGDTVGIVGAGNIGSAIGRLCQALGMEVLATQWPMRPTPYIDHLYPPEQVQEMARRCQWLVSAVPLTPRTERMFNADLFAALPMGARFINISRGAVVDEPALIAALESGRLGGAGLDVQAVEPLPDDSPLWRMERVLMTPHVAGVSANASTAAAELFLRNLHHRAQANPMENQVNVALGF